MPFAEDVRRYTFASLDRLLNKKGEPITNHPYLPTDEQLSAMEDFVDAMDLTDAGDKDEDGQAFISTSENLQLTCLSFRNREPWFDTRYSYNPAIHRTKQAQFHAAVVEDLELHPLPPPHPELLKYLEPPRRVVRRARKVLEECKEVFKVKEVPKRVVKPRRKDGHVYASGDDNEPLLLEKLQRTQSQLRRSQSRFSMSQSQFNPASPKSQRRTQKVVNSDDSATETEDEDEILLDKAGPSTVKSEKAATPPLTPDPKEDQSQEVHLGKAPGRIIGEAYPLTDFKKNIADGDIVSKAVEDLGLVIQDIVVKPFAYKRNEEMLDCMKAFRLVALQVCFLFSLPL